MLNNQFSVVISAPSGAGKTTIIHELMQDNNYGFSISTTTRPRRVNEIEGVNYYYVSSETFQKMIAEDAFWEWAEVFANYYGTSKKEIDRIVTTGKIPIFDIDVQGARSLKSKLPGATFIFIIPPSYAELEKRLRNRKTDDEKQIAIRLQNAKNEIKEYHMYDYIVVNDNLNSALSKIQAIITAEQCKKERACREIDKLLEERK